MSDMATYCIVILFLAQDKAELGMIVIRIFIFGSEYDHDTVLDEVVEVDRIGMKALTLEVVNSDYCSQRRRKY